MRGRKLKIEQLIWLIGPVKYLLCADARSNIWRLDLDGGLCDAAAPGVVLGFVHCLVDAGPKRLALAPEQGADRDGASLGDADGIRESTEEGDGLRARLHAGVAWHFYDEADKFLELAVLCILARCITFDLELTAR